MLSFIGVYYITSDRKQEESDEQLLLTNADLFPGMLVCHMGGVVDLKVLGIVFIAGSISCLNWLHGSNFCKFSRVNFN